MCVRACVRACVRVCVRACMCTLVLPQCNVVVLLSSLYLITHRPDIVTDLTVINEVNIASDHRMAMSNIDLDVEVERNKR